MNVRLTSHSEELLREQLAHGTFRTPEEVIERALEALVQKEGKSNLAARSKSPAEVVAHIRQSRKGVRLGGIKIKDLVSEGRKY